MTNQLEFQIMINPQDYFFLRCNMQVKVNKRLQKL